MRCWAQSNSAGMCQSKKSPIVNESLNDGDKANEREQWYKIKRSGEHSNGKKASFTKCFHLKCNYPKRTNEQAKKHYSRANSAPTKWRVKRLALMKRICNEWTWAQFSDWTASRANKKAPREKVSEFKLKHLTTLNYNMLKKIRLLQMLIFSHHRVSTNRTTNQTTERQVKVGTGQQKVWVPSARDRNVYPLCIFMLLFGTCQHFYN